MGHASIGPNAMMMVTVDLIQALQRRLAVAAAAVSREPPYDGGMQAAERMRASAASRSRPSGDKRRAMASCKAVRLGSAAMMMDWDCAWSQNCNRLFDLETISGAVCESVESIFVSL